MLDNCTYYRNGSLKTITVDDGSVIHYDEDGNLQYVELSDKEDEDIVKQASHDDQARHRQSLTQQLRLEYTALFVLVFNIPQNPLFDFQQNYE